VRRTVQPINTEAASSRHPIILQQQQQQQRPKSDAQLIRLPILQVSFFCNSQFCLNSFPTN
ncbi:unnamed protein product, partial [Rotaria magnacalcarata]